MEQQREMAMEQSSANEDSYMQSSNQVKMPLTDYYLNKFGSAQPPSGEEGFESENQVMLRAHHEMMMRRNMMGLPN